MDNYKILNSYTNKIIKLLNELGYAWFPSSNDSEASLLKAHWILAESSGDIAYSSTDSFYEQDSYKELSFDQLNDLVVLKRNDVSDATHEHQQFPEFKYLHTSANRYAWMVDEQKWEESDCDIAWHVAHTRPVQPFAKDPALISGADALRALADGKEVECKNKVTLEWFNCLSLSVAELVEGSCQYRIKPQAIRVELELPKPFEPQYYEVFYFIDPTVERGYSVARHSMNHKKYLQFGVYSTEDDVKKAVEQLRKIRGAS